MPALWDPLPLRPAEWLRIPASRVEIARLEIGDDSKSCGDQYAHVICCRGVMYVVDGQPLVEEARASGARCLWVRLLTVVRVAA